METKLTTLQQQVYERGIEILQDMGDEPNREGLAKECAQLSAIGCKQTLEAWEGL